MDFFTLSLLCLTLFLFAYLLNKSDKLSALPGPLRLPIFGNVQCNFRKLHLQFTEWAHKFGPVYRIQILTQPAIVLNTYDALKEAYVKKGRDFISRPESLRFKTIGAANGIAFRQYSNEQNKMRKTAIKVAVGQGNMVHLEQLINENLVDLIDLFEQQKGMPFNPKDLIKKYLINVIASLIFGEKFDYDDPILMEMIKFNAAGVEAATIGHEDVDVWTWTKSFNPNYQLCLDARAQFEKTFIPLYNKYKATYIEGHVRGAIDSYIQEVNEGSLTDDNVLGTLIDYFIGGVETTATTLQGFLLILVHNPKIQSKLQADIDEVVGHNRCANLSDKKLLPYAEAAVLELFRFQSVMPILAPRETLNDTEICGYQIPKGTWVFANSWAIHHNEDVYPDTWSFKPERFFDDDGNLVSNDHITRKHIVTFGMGGRSCIGESMAKNRLYLSLCGLMQRFTFIEDENNPAPSCDARSYTLKIVFDLKDYTLRAVPRAIEN